MYWIVGLNLEFVHKIGYFAIHLLLHPCFRCVLLSLTFNILKENLVTIKTLFDVTTITMLLWKKLHAEGDVHSIWLYPHKMHIIRDKRKDIFLLEQLIVAIIVIAYANYHDNNWFKKLPIVLLQGTATISLK